MTRQELRPIIGSAKYDFIRENKNLGGNVIVLMLSGSHAYGMATPNSDIDIRGVAVNRVQELIGLSPEWKSFRDEATDTTIHSLKTFVNNALKMSPGIIEMFGCLPEHVIIKTASWNEITKNKEIFISKRCIRPFWDIGQRYLGKMEDEPAKTSAERISMGKAMAHVVRTRCTLIDILERGEINAYRGKEADLLRSIRDGLYIGEDGKPSSSYADLLKELEHKITTASQNSQIPEEPDFVKAEKLVLEINQRWINRAMPPQ